MRLLVKMRLLVNEAAVSKRCDCWIHELESCTTIMAGHNTTEVSAGAIKGGLLTRKNDSKSSKDESDRLDQLE